MEFPEKFPAFISTRKGFPDALFFSLFLLALAGSVKSHAEESNDNLFLNMGIGNDSPQQNEQDVADTPKPSVEKTLWGGARRFTFKHDLSYVTTEPSQIETNRSSLRFEWGKSISDDYYFHVDVKSLAYFSNDRIAREDDRSIDTDTKIKELYLQGSWDNTSLTVGNKIVVWGESETSPVTDIISPQNQSDLVFTSLDESRISQAMIVLDQYTDKGQLTFIVNPDVRTDEDPPEGKQNSSVLMLGKKFEKDIPEFGFRWKRAMGIGDFSIMLADVTDNQSVNKFITAPDKSLQMYEFYDRYQMLGAAANLNYGDIAIELESAFSKGRAQRLSVEKFSDYAIAHGGFTESDVLQTAFTLKYKEDGLRDWTFGILNTHVFSDPSYFEVSKKNVDDFLVGVSDKYIHETLTLSFTYKYQYETGEKIQNIAAEYSVMDNFSLRLDYFNLDDIGPDLFKQRSVMLRAIYNF